MRPCLIISALDDRRDVTDPSLGYEPQPPTARPASALAAVLVLVLVFFVGLAVGQTGVLSPAASRPSPGAVVPTSPAGSPGPSGNPSANPSAGPGAAPDLPSNFGLFWDALNIIRENFVGRDQLTDSAITYGAIRGMVEALGDTRHSVFLTPEAVQAQHDSLGGNVVGIGVLLGQRGDHVVVISVFSHGPADAAGVKPGDQVVAVDGTNVETLAPEEIAPKVRGEEGSSVTLTVVRPSTGERLDFTMTRAQIEFPAASWTMVPGTKIALLRLIQFTTGSAAELRAARDAAVDQGATSFILDLRSNPGGYVAEAVDVASLFLHQETVYIRELANGDRIPVSTNDAITSSDLPLVVLIDEGTASSSEIVSGAIRSAQRGELVGKTTFGTGTILFDFGLPDGSAIRLAVERWLTPDGDLIFGKGIAPTVEVALPLDQVPLQPDEVNLIAPADVPTTPDDQLHRAIDLLSQ